MALMEWKYTNGFDPAEFATSISKVALVIGSATANASKIYVLN